MRTPPRRRSSHWRWTFMADRDSRPLGSPPVTSEAREKSGVRRGEGGGGEGRGDRERRPGVNRPSRHDGPEARLRAREPLSSSQTRSAGHPRHGQHRRTRLRVHRSGASLQAGCPAVLRTHRRVWMFHVEHRERPPELPEPPPAGSLADERRAHSSATGVRGTGGPASWGVSAIPKPDRASLMGLRRMSTRCHRRIATTVTPDGGPPHDGDDEHEHQGCRWVLATARSRRPAFARLGRDDRTVSTVRLRT